jgi:hypothetical protein
MEQHGVQTHALAINIKIPLTINVILAQVSAVVAKILQQHVQDVFLLE